MTPSIFIRNILGTKLKVGVKQSKFVQEVLFSSRMYWGVPTPQITNTHDRFLFLTFDLMADRPLILSTNSKVLYKHKTQYEEITFDYFLYLAKQVKKYQKILKRYRYTQTP